jgi:hypothetical protein
VRSEGCSAGRFAYILRANFVDANATRFLPKVVAIAKAKLETITIGTNDRSKRSQLLLSLKLRGFAIESRCMSGGISGGVAGL